MFRMLKRTLCRSGLPHPKGHLSLANGPAAEAQSFLLEHTGSSGQSRSGGGWSLQVARGPVWHIFKVSGSEADPLVLLADAIQNSAIATRGCDISFPEQGLQQRGQKQQQQKNLSDPYSDLGTDMTPWKRSL